MKKTRQELLDMLDEVINKQYGGYWGELSPENVMRSLENTAEVLKRVVKHVFPKDEEDDE